MSMALDWRGCACVVWATVSVSLLAATAGAADMTPRPPEFFSRDAKLLGIIPLRDVLRLSDPAIVGDRQHARAHARKNRFAH